MRFSFVFSLIFKIRTFFPHTSIFTKNDFWVILKAKYQNVIYIRKRIKRFQAIQCHLETLFFCLAKIDLYSLLICNISVFLLTIYTSEKKNSVELQNKIISLISRERPNAICGDFSICYNQDKIQSISRRENYKPVVKNPTHIRGRLIDHYYHNFDIGVIVNQYKPFQIF